MADTQGVQAFQLAVAEIDRQIEELQRTRDVLLRFMGRPPSETQVSPTTPTIPVAGDSLTAVREQEFAGMSVAKAATAFLRKIGRHEKTGTIIAAIQKGGVELSAQNPLSTVYTTLSRRPGFVSLGKNYWDLAERRPDLAQEKKAKGETAAKRKVQRVRRARRARIRAVRVEPAAAASA